MTNQTAKRFGHPDTLIQEYDHWWVLLREQQITLGSLVLCAKSDATAYSSLPDVAFAEMAVAVKDIERVLKKAFQYEKINYLMLMMADPNVHYHVVPRYSGERSACGLTMIDQGWPGPPQLGETYDLNADQCRELCDHIREFW